VELLTAFPDAEDVGLALFESLADTVLQTPADLVPPLIVVRRVGGVDDRITDYARVQVHTFGATHAVARNLAEGCRQAALAAPATEVAGAHIDRVVTESAPAYADYGVPTLHRYVATYRFEYRRPR
jgi:hypothetical protein